MKPSGMVRHVTLQYAAVSAAVFLLLAHHHGYVPLWIEGLTEYQTALSTLLRARTDPQPCMLSLGGLQLPLGVAPYVGGGFIYLHAPFVAAWYQGWVDDPYFYRYAGILAFIGIGWLLFILCRRFWTPWQAFWCATVWTTTPYLLFVAIADLQWEFIPIAFVLASMVLFMEYLERRRRPVFYAACFLAGFVGITRIDVLIMSLIVITTYIALFRPPAVVQPLRTAKPPFLFGAVFALLGLLPLILYQFVCPSSRLFAFLPGSVLGATFGGQSAPFLSRLQIRAGQYWTVNVLHKLPFVDVLTPNFVHAVVWIVAALILLGATWRERRIAFPVYAIVLLLPISLISTGVLRPEHLINFQALTALLVARGLGRWAEGETTFRRWAGHGLLAMLVVANIAVAAQNWRAWRSHPADADYITNQSAPDVLVEYLLPYQGERILFTNVGLWNYAQYMTAARLKSENIVSWGGDADFRAAVEVALNDRGRWRIFAGAASQRDGGRFTLSRTGLLHRILAEHQVPYRSVILSTPRRTRLYEITLIEPGRGPKASTGETPGGN